MKNPLFSIITPYGSFQVYGFEIEFDYGSGYHLLNIILDNGTKQYIGVASQEYGEGSLLPLMRKLQDFQLKANSSSTLDLRSDRLRFTLESEMRHRRTGNWN